MLLAAESSLAETAPGEREWAFLVFQESMFYEMFLSKLRLTNTSSGYCNLVWL